MQIVPTRLQESYRQIMDQGKQMQAQLYKKNTRVLPGLMQSQKVVVQLDLSKSIWHQTKSYNAQPRRGDHTASRLYTVESTPGTGGS